MWLTVTRRGRALWFWAVVLFAVPNAVVSASEQPNGLGLPVASACVSSPFGPRVLPGRPLAGTYHYGIDLPAAAGAPVRAVAAGDVLSIHRRGAGGLEVVLRHANFITLYAHLGAVSPSLAEGKRHVGVGEQLGVVGRTGVSYGTHLYFELRVQGERVDPAPYLHVQRCQ